MSEVAEAGREAAASPWMETLARAGLTARGTNYALTGVLAAQIAFGTAGRHAQRVGALRAVATHPGGWIVLVLVAVGYGAMTLWRLAEAAYGRAGAGGRKPQKRLLSLTSAVLYGLLCGAIVGFLLSGSQSSGDHQSKEFTARLMSHSGGRWVVLLIGLVVVGAGIGIAVYGVRQGFMKHLRLGGLSPRVREIVEALGVVGTTARGVVFGLVGAFLARAAITFDAKKAEGLDGALHKLATTPLGPWLLVAVAAGLVTFGIYSCCEARWREVEPG